VIVDAGAEDVEEPDAGVEEPPPDQHEVTAPPPSAEECAVSFNSKPEGADIVIARKKRGRTPMTLNLPCKKTQVAFARSHYAPDTKSVSPKKGTTTKVAVKLERPQFTIKVTSTPSGAAVTVKGKSVGKTPVTVKVDGFESISVKVAKPGFQAKTTSVTAKKNGTSVKVTLKRGN
jgi:hypothetical protein